MEEPIRPPVADPSTDETRAAIARRARRVHAALLVTCAAAVVFAIWGGGLLGGLTLAVPLFFAAVSVRRAIRTRWWTR